MFSFEGDGLGTHWQVLVDESEVSADLGNMIIDKIGVFEKKFSRFLPESEVNILAANRKSEIEISDDLAKMLEFGLSLKKVTQGAFDPDMDGVMSSFGYDGTYTFRRKPIPTKGDFELKGNILSKNGTVKLDLGAFGKGYLVDQIAKFLKKEGLEHFLVNGGGGVYASTKADGSPWLAAIEHPLDPDRAIGEVRLDNHALATSSSQKRRIGDFHHLISARTHLPINNVLSVSVLAPTAMVADGVATALFVSTEEIWSKISEKLKIEFLVVFPDLSFKKSSGFPNLY